MKTFLLSLLPWSRKEWSDFFADLAPLLGLFFFASEPRNIMLPLYAEMYFVFGYGLIRLTSTAIYASIQQGKEMGLGDLEVPEPIFGKIFYIFFIALFGSILILSILCIILLLIGFNFFFYMLIELYLSVAVSGGMNANFSFLTIYNSLSPKEQYYIWGMFLLTLYRYLPKLVHFFREREFKNPKNSWAWLALGTPPVPERNQFQSMVQSYRNWVGSERNPSDEFGSLTAIYFGFLFVYFGSLILMIYHPLLGPVFSLILKAFAELYYFRLYKEVKNSK